MYTQTHVETSTNSKPSSFPLGSSLAQKSSLLVPENETQPLAERDLGPSLDPNPRVSWHQPGPGYSFGNLAIAPKERLGIQPKLTIGQPNDRYEQEADRVADQVMRMPEPNRMTVSDFRQPFIQRLCSECEEDLQRQPTSMEEDEEKKKQLQMKPLQRQVEPISEEEDEDKKEQLQMKSMSEQTPEVSPDLQERISGLQQGRGQPLAESERAFLEPRFGYDFSRVRVHADDQAADMARSVNARAFTVGQNVVFGAGQYQPRSFEGQRLLAHELTHVVQQGNTTGPPSLNRQNATDFQILRYPINSIAEEQANRIANTVVKGLPILETPVQATRLQRQPASEAEPGTPAPPVFQPQSSSMETLLIEWRNAGLLSPPFRPGNVPEIPPLPISQQQATSRAENAAVFAGAAAPALQPGIAPQPTSPVRPPLRVIPGGRGLPTPSPRPVVGPGPLRWLGPIGAAIAILLTPTSTAPPWIDELNPVTGEPYSSPEEYDWMKRLNPDQRDYLRWLVRARRLSPDPTLENDPSPFTLPTPLPQAPPREEEAEEPCFASPITRRGGHARHDAYATKVTGSISDYFVRTPTRTGGLSIAYDGFTSPIVVWEVKVGYGWFFNPQYQSLRDTTLARFDSQKNRGLAVSRVCNYIHVWSIPDRWVASLLNARWGLNPLVLSIPE